MRPRTVTALAALTVGLGMTGGLATAGEHQPPPVESMFAAAPLGGGKVVPGPGDPDGQGTLGLNPGANGEVCWGLEVKNLDPITAAYIHKGTRGTAGPARLALFEDAAGRPGHGVYRECVGGIRPRLVDRILGFGRDFPRRWPWYVELRTATYPAGAVRGQLSMGEPVDLPLSQFDRRGR
jgi:hypothetical protein